MKEFFQKDDTVFFISEKYLFCGFLLEPCSDEREVFINWFVQPLFHPVEHYFFTFGERLKGRFILFETERSHILASSIRKAFLGVAIPAFERYGSLTSIFRKSIVIGDLNSYETALCVAILSKQSVDVAKIMDKIKSIINGSGKHPEYFLNILHRCEDLEALYHQSPKMAIERLDEWREYTWKSLKLDEAIPLEETIRLRKLKLNKLVSAKNQSDTLNRT